jgi:hypothetical protein
VTFISAPPSVIRSIKQRDLLNVWLRLYQRQQQLPQNADYHPERMADEVSDLVNYTVDSTRSPPQFRIETNGSRLASAYGATGRGRDLEEYLGPLRLPTVMPAYFTCVARALPVYTISMQADANGRSVAYERLLLPFFDRNAAADDSSLPAEPAPGVTKIMASLKTISEDGGFEIKNLFRSDQALPAPMLAVVIDTDLQGRNIGIPPDDDICIV